MLRLASRPKPRPKKYALTPLPFKLYLYSVKDNGKLRNRQVAKSKIVFIVLFIVINQVFRTLLL